MITIGEKWQAVIKNDVRYDGKFFYAVCTTKVFCKPSCKSKNPLRRNVKFFDSEQQAMDEGYRPCKRCCPDRPTFSPSGELTEKARVILDKYFADIDELNQQIQKLGVSKSYLNKLFLKTHGMTIAKYLRFVRIRKAKNMLLEGTKVTETAFGCGFNSASSFYSNFKKETGCSPKALSRYKINEGLMS